MNKRDRAILKWLEEKKGPTAVVFDQAIRRVLASEKAEEIMHKTLIQFGFEAGRKFQKENPELPLDDLTIYE